MKTFLIAGLCSCVGLLGEAHAQVAEQSSSQDIAVFQLAVDTASESGLKIRASVICVGWKRLDASDFRDTFVDAQSPVTARLKGPTGTKIVPASECSIASRQPGRDGGAPAVNERATGRVAVMAWVEMKRPGAARDSVNIGFYIAPRNAKTWRCQVTETAAGAAVQGCRLWNIS